MHFQLEDVEQTSLSHGAKGNSRGVTQPSSPSAPVEPIISAKDIDVDCEALVSLNSLNIYLAVIRAHCAIFIYGFAIDNYSSNFKRR